MSAVDGLHRRRRQCAVSRTLSRDVRGMSGVFVSNRELCAELWQCTARGYIRSLSADLSPTGNFRHSTPRPQNAPPPPIHHSRQSSRLAVTTGGTVNASQREILRGDWGVHRTAGQGLRQHRPTSRLDGRILNGVERRRRCRTDCDGPDFDQGSFYYGALCRRSAPILAQRSCKPGQRVAHRPRQERM